MEKVSTWLLLTFDHYLGHMFKNTFFTPQFLRAVLGIVFTHGVQMGSWREKVCLGCISETVRCKKLILGVTLVRGCRCAKSLCDLDLTFNLAVVTLS